MSHLKRIVKYITNVFTGILLVLLVLVIYGKLVSTFGNNVYPNYFGYTFFEVASGSMEPTLHINDVIIVKISKDNLKVDDIIAYQGEKDVITHRILLIDNDSLTVKGDANNTIDKPIKVDQVIGKIVKVCPKLGIWKKVLTDPKILVGIFVTLLLFDFALSYNGNKDKKEEKKEDKKEDTIEIKKIEIPEEVHEEGKEEVKEVKKKESEKLLELTRKINIDEINKLLEGTDLELNRSEINNIKKEAEKVQEKAQAEVQEVPIEEVHEEEVNLSEKEVEAIDYTIRLDLTEIQKKINSKLK